MRASLNAAEAFLAQGKYAEAIRPYERVAGLMPSFYEVQFALESATSRPVEPQRRTVAPQVSVVPASIGGRSRRARNHTDSDESKWRSEAAARAGSGDESGSRRAEKSTRAYSLRSARFAGAAEALEPVLANPGAADAETFILAAQSRAALGQSEKAIEICEAGVRGTARTPGSRVSRHAPRRLRQPDRMQG